MASATYTFTTGGSTHSDVLKWLFIQKNILEHELSYIKATKFGSEKNLPNFVCELFYNI